MCDTFDFGLEQTIKKYLSLKKIFSIIYEENKNIRTIISSQFYPKFSKYIDKINFIENNLEFKKRIYIVDNKIEYLKNIKKIFIFCFYPIYLVFKSKKIAFFSKSIKKKISNQNIQ